MTSLRCPRLPLALLLLGLTQALPCPVLVSTAGAQEEKRDARDVLRRVGPSGSEAAAKLVKEPVPWRVYQRDERNQADIPIVPAEGLAEDEIVSATISPAIPRQPLGAGTYRDGKLVNVPAGGPYQVNIVVRTGEPTSGGPATRRVSVGPVFVGDLWVLAGQSNMEGVGDLIDVTPPSPRVAALGMDGKWVQAEEPLHWLVDSPDPVHSGNPADREARSKDQHRNRVKGAGLGLPFAAAMVAATNVPVGLVVSAHGGTSMKQWDPAKKGEGGNSLYGSMLRQVKLAGGKVRGVLWYQGESDSTEPAASEFGKNFANFIAAVRDDLGDPELPFYYVQIGRFIVSRESKGWNAVQEAQRLIPDRVPNTAVVASIDLELDDLIHIGTPGLKRLGTRLARIAQRELFGQVGATTPTLDRVRKGPDNTLVLKFKGVNRAQSLPFGGQPQGFTTFGGMGGMGGSGSSSQQAAVAQPPEGLRPARHVAGFSIRKEDGTEVPLIYDAAVGPSKDTVVLKLFGNVPEGAKLWYGYGLDPYCNLTDALDMAVPVFGPIALDDLK